MAHRRRHAADRGGQALFRKPETGYIIRAGNAREQPLSRRHRGRKAKQDMPGARVLAGARQKRRDAAENRSTETGLMYG
jgi:hypothetical protein